MREIHVLSPETIDKIAAGEVVERPSSIVKELVENAIDAGSGAVTVEIREGGVSLIRVTDNGEGIAPDQIRTAFLRHATSKLHQLEDLDTIETLGFRGEALSSICAVAMTEMITKTRGSVTGVRYRIDGGVEKGFEEIGAPEGTTILVRNLFYNVPARKKFLKSSATETGYINTLMERLALSHPDISFKFISNGQTKLHTSGNNSLKDIIYSIYGRETAKNLMEIPEQDPRKAVRISGVIGKPVLSRGNRNYENFFVNGRFVHSGILSRAIEEGFGNHLMQHRYPFTVLFIDLPGDQVDINVHPAKLEVRFSDGAGIFELVKEAVAGAFSGQEMIVKTLPGQVKEEQQELREEKRNLQKATAGLPSPEPFEKLRQTLLAGSDSPYQPRYPQRSHRSSEHAPALVPSGVAESGPAYGSGTLSASPDGKQMNFLDDRLLSEENRKEHHIVGQVFDTYWIVQFRDQMYIIDQHAAHEKVNYERLRKRFENHSFTSQQLSPPIVCTLTLQEETVLETYLSYFTKIGFEIEHFGGHDYQISAAPDQLLRIDDRDLFLEILDSLADLNGSPSEELLDDRLATMACKMSVKGGDRLNAAEADALIGELLRLDNPYQCPHGRPTIIAMSRYDLEKKFKRIV